jgi:hypothetical protein
MIELALSHDMDIRETDVMRPAIFDESLHCRNRSLIIERGNAHAENVDKAKHSFQFSVFSFQFSALGFRVVATQN